MTSLVGIIEAMEPGKIEGTVGEKPFMVYYDQEQAIGDNGQPVRGDFVGDYEVVIDGRVAFRQHVSPFGSSGYGNNGAKSYAAERVARFIAARHAGIVS